MNATNKLKPTALRALIVGTLVEVKAYNLPSICERLGLSSGETSEAMQSKGVYVSSRLQGIQNAQLESIVRELNEEFESFELTETVALFDEITLPPVTAITRRALATLLGSSPLIDNGDENDELELYRQAWPLDKIPSPYGRYGNQSSLNDALVQHTIANYDWDFSEVLRQLGFFECSNRQLFRFLEAVLSPEYQSADAQAEKCRKIDDLLRHDGYRVQVKQRLSGRNVYKIELSRSESPAAASIAEKLRKFDPTQVAPRWEKALERQETDPEGAITAARTLLEDVCKWLIEHLGKSWSEKDDLPKLYKLVRDELNLAPDNHTEIIFKQILGNCQAIVESVGALRSKIGDAHSPGPRRVKPAPRHATLVVNLAGAMATFLIATWEARQSKE